MAPKSGEPPDTLLARPGEAGVIWQVEDGTPIRPGGRPDGMGLGGFPDMQDSLRAGSGAHRSLQFAKKR